MHLAVILSLAISFMISPAKSQHVACTPGVSPQCCWVVRMWQLMGKRTSTDPTSRSACCKMEGISCSDSKVTKINWEKQQLTDHIPSEIGYLVELKEL
jgi:hypothetical protein